MLLHPGLNQAKAEGDVLFFDTVSRIIFHFRCDNDTWRVSMCSYHREVKYYITSGNKSKEREIGDNALYLYCEILM